MTNSRNSVTTPLGRDLSKFLRHRPLKVTRSIQGAPTTPSRIKRILELIGTD